MHHPKPECKIPAANSTRLFVPLPDSGRKRTRNRLRVQEQKSAGGGIAFSESAEETRPQYIVSLVTPEPHVIKAINTNVASGASIQACRPGKERPARCACPAARGTTSTLASSMKAAAWILRFSRPLAAARLSENKPRGTHAKPTINQATIRGAGARFAPPSLESRAVLSGPRFVLGHLTKMPSSQNIACPMYANAQRNSCESGISSEADMDCVLDAPSRAGNHRAEIQEMASTEPGGALGK